MGTLLSLCKDQRNPELELVVFCFLFVLTYAYTSLHCPLCLTDGSRCRQCTSELGSAGSFLGVKTPLLTPLGSDHKFVLDPYQVNIVIVMGNFGPKRLAHGITSSRCGSRQWTS